MEVMYQENLIGEEVKFKKTNYSGLFFKNEEEKFCSFLELINSQKETNYYEAFVCLNSGGPKQNLSGIKYKQYEIEERINKKGLMKIVNEAERKKIINFLEERREEGKYKLFWKEFEEIRF